MERKNSANLALDEQDYERAYEEASLGLSIRNSISLDSYNSSFSHNTLGLYFYGQGLFEKAKYHFEKAVQIKTTALGKHINESLATAHFNLALALEELKDTKAAMEYEISEKMYRRLKLTDDADTAKEHRQNIENN